MSWENRDYNRGAPGGGGGGGAGGRPGGDWQGVRPSFDNPMSWSLPLGRWFGIHVRVHIILLLYIIFELLRAMGAPDKGESVPLGLFYVSSMMGGLFVIILLHEFGHCLACRSTGGTADEILLWPLGGLAFCAPPHRWKAHLWTVVGGPLVNVALIPVFAAPIGLLTGYWWGVALPMPGYWRMEWWALEDSHVNIVLVLIAKMNVALFIFNLLPMFPMDGGRILQSLLWPRFGYVRSMRFAVRVGYIGAICLGLYGLAVQEGTLICLAVFGGIVCYNTHRQLQYTEETMGFEYGDYAQKLGDEEKSRERGPSKRELKRQRRESERAEQESRELDRLLAKIKQGGMSSLSSREQKWLRTQTDRRKQGQ